MTRPTAARTIRRAARLLDDLPPAMLGQVIEALIARLDALDGDPDLEAEDDRCEFEDRKPEGYMGTGDADDAEPDDEEGDPTGEDLGTSGRLVAHFSATRGDHKPGDADDGEPSLGWPERVKQPEADAQTEGLSDREYSVDDFTLRDSKVLRPSRPRRLGTFTVPPGGPWARGWML